MTAQLHTHTNCNISTEPTSLLNYNYNNQRTYLLGSAHNATALSWVVGADGLKGDPANISVVSFPVTSQHNCRLNAEA